MDEASTRYCVGIDLGTTNTVMSYVDRESEHPAPVCFRVTQVVARKLERFFRYPR